MRIATRPRCRNRCRIRGNGVLPGNHQREQCQPDCGQADLANAWLPSCQAVTFVELPPGVAPHLRELVPTRPWWRRQLSRRHHAQKPSFCGFSLNAQHPFASVVLRTAEPHTPRADVVHGRLLMKPTAAYADRVGIRSNARWSSFPRKHRPRGEVARVQNRSSAARSAGIRADSRPGVKVKKKRPRRAIPEPLVRPNRWFRKRQQSPVAELRVRASCQAGF